MQCDLMQELAFWYASSANSVVYLNLNGGVKI